MKEHVNKLITITGYFHELIENENYYFKGEEAFHPKYGFQFNVKEYERVKPEDKDGIVEFLSSDLFPGIGEKMAQSIVDILGDKALDVRGAIVKNGNAIQIFDRNYTKAQKFL